MKNRYLNDLVPDLFCMFPLMTTIHFYRLFHLGHHQFTNDPGRDPDLLNLGYGKRFGEFPMTRFRFIALIYFAAVVAPLRFLAYQWAYFTVNTLGKGQNEYFKRVSPEGRGPGALPRLGTALGVLYVIGLGTMLKVLTGMSRPEWLLPAGLLGLGMSLAALYVLPEWAIFRSPMRQAYSPRIASAIRLAFYTTLIMLLAHVRWFTGGRSSIYPVFLWFVPQGTTFMFFMLLRDVYQHSNAGTGRLTNSRVFFADPFTRWAVFVYGQDMHIPHHLFPAVPHYRLRRLHELLRRDHSDYRDVVVETHGTFHDALGRTTILDEMIRPQVQPAAAALGSV
jgi:fatty acid desaturase